MRFLEVVAFMKQGRVFCTHLREGLEGWLSHHQLHVPCFAGQHHTCTGHPGSACVALSPVKHTLLLALQSQKDLGVGYSWVILMVLGEELEERGGSGDFMWHDTRLGGDTD